MSLVIQSPRFGAVEIDPSSVVEFPDGLIGLGGSRYALVARDPDSPFLWLQSLDEPSLALPVVNPHRFFAEFAVEVTDEDAERFGLSDAGSVDVYVTVRAADALDDFTANLKAPILIHSGQGCQVINQAGGADLRASLFAGVDLEPEPAPSAGC